MNKSISLLWGNILLRNDYLYIYYFMLIALFSSQFFFASDDAQNLIVLYGLFSSLITIQVITLHKRYNMQLFFWSSQLSNAKIVLMIWCFSFIISFPAVVFLTIFEKYFYAETPLYLIFLVVIVLQIFSVSIAFFIHSLFDNGNVSILILVVIYFILILFYGFRMEYIRHISPVLNFMYPDKINFQNIIGVLSLSFSFVAFSIWFHKRPSSRKMKTISGVISCVMVMNIVGLYYYETYLEKTLAKQEFQSFEKEKTLVKYKGISKEEANQFASVYLDIKGELEYFGLGSPFHTIQITRLYKIPSGENVENIISSSRKTMVISPFSNKYFEFNYGYNITEDMINAILNQEWPTEKQKTCYQIFKKVIEQRVVLKNHHLFTETKRNQMKNLQLTDFNEKYLDDFLVVLKNRPQQVYSYILELEQS